MEKGTSDCPSGVHQVSVLLGLQLPLPGLIQVNQSFVVDDKKNEVQRVRGDADDAELLQHEVQNVGQVQGPYGRHDGGRHEDQSRHGACCEAK